MTTHRISITFNAEWQIENMSYYKIDRYHRIFNAKTGRLLKMVVKDYTKGYYLCGDFYSLKQINALAKSIIPESCPF